MEEKEKQLTAHPPLWDARFWMHVIFVSEATPEENTAPPRRAELSLKNRENSDILNASPTFFFAQEEAGILEEERKRQHTERWRIPRWTWYKMK